MAETIFKYPLQLVERQTLTLPRSARCLTVQLQHGIPTLWAQLERDEEIGAGVDVYVVGTGKIVPTEARCYVATYQNSGFVWHIYTNQHPFENSRRG